MELSRRRFLHLSGALGAATALGGLAPFTARAGEVARPAAAAPSPLGRTSALHYVTPGRADDLIETGLPVGNGRLGALWSGDPATDTLCVSDGSLWSGGANDILDSGGQFPYDTDVDSADGFGTLSVLARLHLELPGHTDVVRYRRTLDLATGVAALDYRMHGARYRREVIASHPDDVVVVRLSQTGGGTYTGSLRLEGAHDDTTTARADDASASFAGALANGLRYAATVSAAGTGGRIDVADGTVTFAGCTEVVVVLTGGTDYVPDPDRDYRDRTLDPAAVAHDKVRAALGVPWTALLATHTTDHRALFDALAVDLGRSTSAQRGLSTPQRLAARAATGAAPDPELDATYLQFGRYLTICGSRDRLPTGLQGLWLDRNDPSWGADYHTDINLQMNYWLPDRAGLPSAFEALADYCLAQVPKWTAATQQLFQDPRNGFRNSSGTVAGWTTAISTNIHGGPGWWWHPAGNAWLCMSLYEHYQYTQDRAYLERILPLLRGACEFWQARLIERTVTDDSGTNRTVLVDDEDWSPENGPTGQVGVTYAQEAVWKLFQDYQDSCATLGSDEDFAATVAGLQHRLYLPRVSATTGWLEEWMTDANLGEVTHRHLSPLLGFSPGDRITLDESSAEILTGVRALLIARGMSSFGWGCAWRAMCWARLQDADRAYQLVGTVMTPSANFSNGAADNLFDMYSFGSSSVFQIDANYGTPTAMLDMLVYSRPGVITLLPALPDAWATAGSVTGLGARGGFTVDVAWKDAQVKSVAVRSEHGGSTELRFGDWSQRITVAAGGTVSVKPPNRPRTWSVRNRASGLVLQVPGGSTAAGTGLTQGVDTGADFQRWRMLPVGGGRFTLRNVHSGVIANVSGGGSNPGASIVQWPESGSTNEQWTQSADGGWSTIDNVRSGLPIGVRDSSTQPGAAIEQQTVTGDAGQQWRLVARY